MFFLESQIEITEICNEFKSNASAVSLDNAKILLALQ